VTVRNCFFIIVLHSSEQYFSYIHEVNVFNDISIVYIDEGGMGWTWQWLLRDGTNLTMTF